jgi:5'-phosphate synthase pdxT subunit
MVTGPVGVLALQGAFQKHIDMLRGLGVTVRSVRLPADLAGCTGLIIPGGESTTMSRLIEACAFHEELAAFAQTSPVMGTCAGLILMAQEVDDAQVRPLGLLPCKALRNYYGRQINSFVAPISLDMDASSEPFRAVFIRSPAVTDLGTGVEVLARYDGRAVILGYQHHVAVAFHPELTDDSRIHEHWLRGFLH